MLQDTRSNQSLDLGSLGSGLFACQKKKKKMESAIHTTQHLVGVKKKKKTLDFVGAVVARLTNTAPTKPVSV